MKSKVYSLPDEGVTVREDKIYNQGKLFAELRYLRTDKAHHKHRGLAIYYYPYDKEVWIFPEKRWGIFESHKAFYSVKEIEAAWPVVGIRGLLFNNRRADKGEAISAWCYDVKISEDGKYVNYKTKGILFDSSHKYLVEYGVSK
jgi:hypothetical protein